MKRLALIGISCLLLATSSGCGLFNAIMYGPPIPYSGAAYPAAMGPTDCCHDCCNECGPPVAPCPPCGPAVGPCGGPWGCWWPALLRSLIFGPPGSYAAMGCGSGGCGPAYYGDWETLQCDTCNQYGGWEGSYTQNHEVYSDYGTDPAAPFTYFDREQPRRTKPRPAQPRPPVDPDVLPSPEPTPDEVFDGPRGATSRVPSRRSYRRPY
jgi:hypothetical protein